LAERIVERYFPDLDDSDVVLDPTAGRGHFLAAVPAHIPAFGVELDPEEAALGRRLSGREIIVGDVRDVEITLQPTLILGNPPFKTTMLDVVLERAHGWLPEGGRVGLILPAFMFQTAGRVVRYASRWSMRQEMIPRNVYQRLRHHLCFALFSKDRRRTMVGFAFYRETDAIDRLGPAYRELLRTAGNGGVWRRVVTEALARLGGEAPLQVLYHEIEGRRPTKNPFWRDKIRQVAQEHCVRVGRGRYALPMREAA